MPTYLKPGIGPAGSRKSTTTGMLPSLTSSAVKSYKTTLILLHEERALVDDFQALVRRRDHIKITFNNLMRCALYRLQPDLIRCAAQSESMTLEQIQAYLMHTDTNDPATSIQPDNPAT